MSKTVRMSKTANMSETDTAPDTGAGTVSPVEKLLALMSQQMQAVDSTIIDRMDSPVDMIPALAGHLVSSGGKRIRPLLTVAAAEMLGYSGDRHVRLGAIVEFIHTATLLHDDVVDGSSLRRGKRTANLIWGNQPSVLVGDFLFSRAFQLMVEDGSLEVLRILSGASAVIAEGEVLQLQAAQDLGTTEDIYLKVVGAKTAALFAAACEVAAVVADRTADEQQAMFDYGNYLGIGFQIADDVLDYAADAAALGKAPGDDFREGKVTLPVIRAYGAANQSGNADDTAFWQRVIKGEKHQSDGDLERGIDMIRSTGALDSSYETALAYAQKAKDALDCYPDSAIKSLLRDLADYAVRRRF